MKRDQWVVSAPQANLIYTALFSKKDNLRLKIKEMHYSLPVKNKRMRKWIKS